MKKVLEDIQHPGVRLDSSLKGISSEGFLRKTNECKLEQKERRDCVPLGVCTIFCFQRYSQRIK